MDNSGDESDSLIMPREQVKASSWMPPGGAQLAWEDMKLEVSITDLPEPKKVSKIKKLLQCVGLKRKEEK